MVSLVLGVILMLACPVAAFVNQTLLSYNLVDIFAGTTFFDNFYFETMNDPTNGYVDYVDMGTAFTENLAQFRGEQVYMGVDHTNIVGDNERGRKSIRITSRKVYNGVNLVVIDLEHMPSSSGALTNGCSVWPAFWMVGPDWPNTGEIDIIEYVNNQANDLTTLHTSDGCEQSTEDTSQFTGTWSTAADGVSPATDCSVYAPNQWSNQGCGINGWSQPVGSAFNDQKGGVYALEWVPGSFIRAFFFPREAIPSDLVNNTPKPDTWGAPYARFLNDETACPAQRFRDQQLVFDTTFCGDWAGSNFAAMCGTATTCVDYVKYKPADFEETYWLVNYVKVFAPA